MRLIVAQSLQSLKLHMPALQGPLVILLKQHGADQADDGAVVREDSDYIHSALYLRVQSFQGIGAVDLMPGPCRARSRLQAGTVTPAEQAAQIPGSTRDAV